MNHDFDSGFFLWLQVAVKTLKESAADKEKRDLQHELAVMKMLDPHPNVVRLLGCCTEKDPIFVILEFVSGGTLQVCVILMKLHNSGFFLDIRSKTQGEKSKTQAQENLYSRNFGPKHKIPANFSEI